MIKRPDRAVYETLGEFAQGEFRSGTRVFGLDSGAVDLSYTGGFIDEFRPRLEVLKARIIAGDIDVPCIPTSRADAARALGITLDACVPGY